MPPIKTIIGALSNFNVSFNISIISLVLFLMNHHIPQNSESNKFHISTEDFAYWEGMASACLFIGMITGQIGLGYLGKIYPVFTMFKVTILFCLIGSILSAVFAYPSSYFENQEYFVLIFSLFAISRFVFGIGAGGTYPLSAALVLSDSPSDSLYEVSLIFSFQGVGFVCAPICFLIFHVFFGSAMYWLIKASVLLGSLPSIVIYLIIIYQKQRWTSPVAVTYELGALDEETVPAVVYGREEESTSYICQIKEKLELSSPYTKALIGTCTTWFLFDICFYGNAIFKNEILAKLFTQSNAEGIALKDLLIFMISLPGYWLALLFLRRISPDPRNLLYFGCGGMTIVYFILYFIISSESLSLTFIIYSFSFLFANCGPNTATFMMPGWAFAKSANLTFYNGLSAASGKLGALAGTLLFGYILGHGDNLSAVLLVCGLLSICTMILCRVFIE